MENDNQSAAPKPSRLIKELYFPTQIYYRDLPDSRALNDDLRRAIYGIRDGDPSGIVRSNVAQAGSWHSRTDVHTRPEFQKFLEHVTATFAQIFEDLGYHPGSQPVCDNMWANINPRHGYNRHHTHPNVLWSGAYYVQAPADSGRIYFQDPRAQAHVMTALFRPESLRKAECWSEVYYEPIEGRLILFPAWLSHEVQPNLSTLEGPAGDRISISFNVYQKRPKSEEGAAAAPAAAY